MTEPLIAIDGLHKHYTLNDVRIDVLRGLTLEVATGERLSIMGKSGAGKSTLLHVLGTLDRPSGGTVRFAGEDVFALKEAALARYRNRHIGFVWQFHHLLPDFTALENLLIPARMAGLKPAEAKARATELLDQVGLSERLAHRPGELSGGEQQRVSIARALMMNPRLILADEPTGNLDAQMAAGIHELLSELNKRFDTTLIVATHNQELADRMDRRLRLADGRLEPLSAAKR